MNLEDFKRILISFADSANDVSIEKGRVTAIVRGELIEVQIKEREGELSILEDKTEWKIKNWISTRLAELPAFARRILDYSPSIEKLFIPPTGILLDDIEYDPKEIERPIDDVLFGLQEVLGRKIPGTTGVVYLTSDAGEGKTTIINQLARTQAELFTKKETNWLLVPIPLGGRPFLRFDDIIIASLVNKLRYRSLYYDSFIELVKLGLIVPAFDGFEEMLLESSTGEALSATGQLMTKLNSSGNVLIAARQAFFDYQNFDTQAKLFDTIGKDSVTFSKVAINRWTKKQFVDFAFAKGIAEGEEIYEIVKGRLGTANHPLLTRPVLVNKLLTVVQSKAQLSAIESSLENSNQYFPKFVDAIMVREAETKWIDTSGDPFKPLLSVTQHYNLLAVLAEEMWLNNTNSLSFDIVDLLADLYCETQKLPAKTIRQVKDRIKMHALLVKAEQNINQLRFDHEEFQEFFLGIDFYNTLFSRKLTDFKNLIRRGLVHSHTVDTIVSYAQENSQNSISDVIKLLHDVQINELPSSFVKENCGIIILKILSGRKEISTDLSNYAFPSNSLNGVNLYNLVFKQSYFQSTRLSTTCLTNCRFENCKFDSLQLDASARITNTVLRDSEVLSVQNTASETGYYDPFNISKQLISVGFIVESTEKSLVAKPVEIEIDKDLEIVERALRRFIRSSQINDDIFRMRLGQSAEYFISNLVPILIENKVLTEMDYVGSGQKRRFKLIVPFDKINTALKECNGSFKLFLESLRG